MNRIWDVIFYDTATGLRLDLDRVLIDANESNSSFACV
jgi:hypothetical protein